MCDDCLVTACVVGRRCVSFRADRKPLLHSTGRSDTVCLWVCRLAIAAKTNWCVRLSCTGKLAVLSHHIQCRLLTDSPSPPSIYLYTATQFKSVTLLSIDRSFDRSPIRLIFKCAKKSIIWFDVVTLNSNFPSDHMLNLVANNLKLVCLCKLIKIFAMS